MADATKIFSLLVLDSGPLYVFHFHNIYVVGFLGYSKVSLYLHFTRCDLSYMGSCPEGTTSFIPLNFRCFFKYFTSLRSSITFPFLLKLCIMCFSLLFVYLFGPVCSFWLSVCITAICSNRFSLEISDDEMNSKFFNLASSTPF